MVETAGFRAERATKGSARSRPCRSSWSRETWRRVSQTILKCAKETLGKTKGGTRGDNKSAWFWNEEVQAAVKRKKEAYKLWQKTRAPEHLTAYRKLKRLAKTAAKAKNVEMDALYEKLDGPEGEKFAIRLAKARHRVSLDIRVVKI
ncbi:unnamed protein product [Heligmosomoides polygyrus]|uniref:Transposase n=1 Tax=Heligmosomoides polygyrus TaxID=6339 RepID=A0A183FG19_HELPZ|nr:unnamed protein product [Heligmosomoides polygyrus]